jgi:hypothetical protein
MMPGIPDSLGIDQPLLLVFKLLLIIGGLCYVVFAFVVIRQLSVMKKTLITTLAPEISALGWVHLIMAGGLFLYFVML